MAWPGICDYEEAMQNPAINLLDSELRKCKRARSFGSAEPPYSGQFASVFRVIDQKAKTEWAVRCFLSQSAERERRYKAIHDELERAKLSCLVDFQYIPRGIKVGGMEYPVIRMPWIEGKGLVQFITSNIKHPQTLLDLADQWIDLIAKLHDRGIAHGDLQHENVLVVGNQITLVDYDGMFVPALANLPAAENGMENYQHPDRNSSHFGEYLDNFSSWVIFVSLVCIAHDPALWSAVNEGDNRSLLFIKDDYKDPGSSQIIQRLLASKNYEIKQLAEKFCEIIALGTKGAPRLEVEIRAMRKRYHAVLGFAKLPQRQQLDLAHELLAELWNAASYPAGSAAATFVEEQRREVEEAYIALCQSISPAPQTTAGATASAGSALATNQLIGDALARSSTSLGAKLRFTTSPKGDKVIAWPSAWDQDGRNWTAVFEQVYNDAERVTSVSGITSR